MNDASYTKLNMHGGLILLTRCKLESVNKTLTDLRKQHEKRLHEPYTPSTSVYTRKHTT